MKFIKDYRYLYFTAGNPNTVSSAPVEGDSATQIETGYSQQQYEVLLGELSLLTSRIDTDLVNESRSDLCRNYLSFLTSNSEGGVSREELSSFLQAQNIAGDLNAVDSLILELRNTSISATPSDVPATGEQPQDAGPSLEDQITARMGSVEINTDSLDSIEFNLDQFFPPETGLNGVDLANPLSLFDLPS